MYKYGSLNTELTAADCKIGMAAMAQGVGWPV